VERIAMSHGLLSAIAAALGMAFMMGWVILWTLVLGFALSGVVQAVVTKGEMSRLLPDSHPRAILLASALGAASSSCSYAAVALARSLFRKGADFVAAMAFQFASTNLVLELGVILWVLMGWQFTLAEFVGGPVMIALLVPLLRRAMTPVRLAEARKQAERGIAGRMEGHAANGYVALGRQRTGTRLLAPRLHRDQAFLRHGLGERMDGHRGRPADRGRARRVGAE
jgi:uncharacterized protein